MREHCSGFCCFVALALFGAMGVSAQMYGANPMATNYGTSTGCPATTTAQCTSTSTSARSNSRTEQRR